MLSDFEIQQIADRIIAALSDRSALPQQDEMLDAHGAAKLLGCSVATIERRTRDGSIPSTKIGNLRRFRKSLLLSLKTSEEGSNHAG